MTQPVHQHGRAIIIVGPSGAGKDSCIEWALNAADDAIPLIRAHRYITRPPGAGEQHVPVSDQDFQRRLTHNLFAVHWQANGLSYGIGCEVDQWIAAGMLVIINGSRAALAGCCAHFKNCQVVHITAQPAILAQRLAGRGRESAADIEARLKRQVALTIPNTATLTTIHNDGALSKAGAELLSVFTQMAFSQSATEPAT